MNRRSCLALLGTATTLGLVGCLSNESPDDTRTDPPTASAAPDPATNPPSTPRPPTDQPATASGATPTATESEAAPTATPPAVETPAPGSCEAVAVPHPSTGAGLPDPRAYPERPSPLTEATVHSYLEDFETAYRHNSILAEIATEGGCLRNMGVSVYGSEATAGSDGFVGSVETFASYTGTWCETPAESVTPTPLPHADLPVLTARYYVTDRFVIRNGSVVECWD